MKSGYKYSKGSINIVLKRSIAMMLVIVMMIGILPSGFGTVVAHAEANDITPDYSWYGDGTSSNFSISSASQLLGFANLVNGLDGKTAATFSGKTITLTADVDLTGDYWMPIGYNENYPGPSPYDGPIFEGTFDGGSHSISGISVNITGPDKNVTTYGGFFGVASSGSAIKNVRLIEPQISVTGGKGTSISTAGGGAYVGGIAGLTGGKIENCHVIGGTVTVGCNAGGSSDVASGGIVGRVGYSASVQKCSSSANVSSMPVTTTSGTYAEQDKIPPSLIGGIVGDNRGTIENCTSSGNIVNEIPLGTKYAKALTGGIAGLNNSTNIKYCYFNGSVSGNPSKGSVGLGGIMGGTESSNTTSNCYYNKDKVTNPTQTQGKGLTTAELKAKENFAGWDFTGIWEMGADYPVLKGSMLLPIDECKCEIGAFSVAGDDNIIIPYGKDSATFTLSPEIPNIDSTQCTIPGHKDSRDIKFTYIIKSAGSSPETICDGASINPDTKVITFTKAGTYTVDVYAGDPVSQKIQKASASFTVKNEGCTCVIPDFTFLNQSVAIPHNTEAGSYTFINPSLTLTGDCPIAGHNETDIEYSYSVVEHDTTITSASIAGNILNVKGEGKVTVRLTAVAPGTGANAVSKDAEINFTKDKCGCIINDFAFEGGSISIPLGQSTAQKIFDDPSVTYKACDKEGHADKSIEFQYSIVDENNTAGAVITDKTLTVTKNGSVTVKIKAGVPGTDAVLEKTATFNVVTGNIEIPEHLKNIRTIAGNSATLGWDANCSGSLDIEIKNSGGTVVKKATVNIADRKYTVPAEVLTGLGTYTAELLIVGTSTVLTAQIEILPSKTSILLNPAPNTYYDNESSVSLSWRTSNEIAGSTKMVTVKKGTAEYSNFSVQGNTVTISNIQKPVSAKDTYMVSAAISYGGKVVASDSFSFDVYKTNPLEIVNASGGTCSLASPLLISNVSAAGSMTQPELLEKANSFNLQRSVKLKNAYSSYGEDKYQWTVEDTKIASISGSRNGDGYYPSNAEMKITGLKEGETTVTVKHVSTGASAAFKVKVETLENKLYILKAPVNTSINLQYTVGSQIKNITTNSNGMAAIFERNPLSGDIVVYGEASGKIYMGRTSVSQLVSGEISAANTTYPVSNINAAASTNITIKLSGAAKETIFQFMGKPTTQNGKLIKDVNLSVKGYLLKNDRVVDTKTQNVKITRTDYQNVTLQFDTSGLGTVNPSDKIKFVYEITGDQNSPYAPAYASIEPASGTENFSEVPVTLQAAQKSQTAYINSIVMSDSLNGTWEDITSRTDSLNLNDKTTVKYVKAIICWPKNQIGTVDLVNSNGDVVGASSLTTINSTITDMNYGWQEAIIKVDANLIAKGKSLKFSYKLYDTVAQKSVQIPSNFVLANMTGVKSYDMQSAIPFLNPVGTGSTGMKILGNRQFEVPLPKDLGVSYAYEFNEDPLNGRFAAIIGWGGENLTSKTKEKDPAFKEAFKKAADMVKNKTKVKNSGGSLNVNVGGFLMGDIKYLNGEWTLIVTGGGIYGGVEGSYSFKQTQFVGPIPVCYGVEFKAGAELTVALERSRIAGNVNGKNFDQMFDVYLRLYGSIMAYGGVGFDFGFIAARIGLFGQLGLEFYFRSSFIENARRAGGQLKIAGSMGIEAVFKFLFWKKRYVLCEAGFKKNFAPFGFDYSQYGGLGAPTFRSMRFVQKVQGADGKLYDLFESDYMLDDRDYLTQPQLWNDGSKVRATYSLISLTEAAPTTIGINQYPYGYPMISDDGKIMAMLSDFGSAKVNDTGAAYSIKNDNGTWSKPVRIYNQNTPASSLTFDGTSSFAGATWESTENSVSVDNSNENVSTVDISTSLSKSEIYAAIYNGTSWVTNRITDNNEADMAPAISANNGHAVVVWQRVAPSADDPMNVVTKNELWYSVFDGTNWSQEKMLDSGDAGNIKSFSSAVASDGSAMVAANVDVDRDDDTINDREVFTYYISKDGTVTRKNLTNNGWQDGGSKVTARKINAGNEEKEYFFTAWYSEQVDGNNALLSNDIKLSVCGVDGEKAEGFPSSLGSGTGNLNFIKSTDTALNSFGILWSQVSGTQGTASQTLYARLLTSGDNGSIVVTSPYAITSVNPDSQEIVKFEAASKKVDNGINVEAVYLKNNLEFVNEDDLTVLKATSADLMSVSRVITEAIDIGNIAYDAAGIQSGAILPITIPVHNNGLSKVNALKVKANDQEFTIAKSILPDETVEAVIDYKVDEAVSDVTIEVTPEYANGALGDKATVKVMLSKPDLSIKSVVLSGTGDGGKRIFDVNLKNEGIKSIADNGYKVQITVYEDFSRKTRAAIEDLSSGETITNGRIIIADPEKLGDIDAKSGTCKIGYTVLPDAYDNNGNKTLYIDADIIDSDGLIVDEATYAENQSGISFTSPKLLYPSQFEATVIQENKDGVTEADITVRNLYPEAGKDTLRLRLMNQNEVIEEKNIPVNLNAESSMNDTITFTKSGTEIKAAFIGDIKTEPTYPSDSDSSSEPGQTTVGGKVIDENGQLVNVVETKVTTEANGNLTVEVKSKEAILIRQPDGTKAPLGDTQKLGFDVEDNTNVSISADGTIKINNLAKGTESKILVTYDLGNGQKITIGEINIKVDSNGNVSLNSTLIDPYGIITDAATGKPIEGAHVKLYYADTERNKAAGKTPGTLVVLPVIDGFKPNDNKNPQLSDVYGAYGFMVFPTSDYYIVVTKDGYDELKSPTIPVEYDIVSLDFKMNKPDTGMKRLAGLDRIDTSLEIAKASYTGKLSNIVLATAENYPDALTGSVLAYKYNAPILLVGSSAKDQEKVLSYMKEHMDSAGTVYILGGTGVISTHVEEKIIDSGFKNIKRLGGADRYETSLKIAEQLGTITGTPVILVSGENYPDALAISSTAAAMQYPILLVQKDGISDAIKKKIAEIKPIRAYIIGLQGVISTTVEDQITELAKESIIRIGGTDRYETSAAVAKYFNLSGQKVCIATGNNFPDALAGSVYAGNNNAPIILVDGSLSNNQIDYLRTRKITGAAIFGGEAAVSKEIRQQIEQLIEK